MSRLFPHPATTILVVDDDLGCRRVASRILGEEGYRVFEAASCEEALEVLRLEGGRIDLIVVDVVMPECNGLMLAAQVLEQWPLQRILYMSAHPVEILAPHGLPSLEVPFLAKPYTYDEMIAKTRQALERRQTSRPEKTG